MDCSNINKKALFLNISFLFLITLYCIFSSPSSHPFSSHNNHLLLHHSSGNNLDQDETTTSTSCTTALRQFADHKAKCAYVKSESSCSGKGYLNYLEIFYCNHSIIGYSLLVLWLLILFYVLGNTTAEYFCPSIEGLSRILNLSPTIAGTTLLPLGNGANDVFSSIISFTRSGNSDVGLNSVLGGAFFISCFVVGVVSISISSRGVKVDRRSFVRDVLFFLFVLCCLLVIVAFGKIGLWAALCFLSLYFLYIALVYVMHCKSRRGEDGIRVAEFSDDECSSNNGIGIPLLGYVEDEEKGCLSSQKTGLKNQNLTKHASCYSYSNLILKFLELPLSLPRKLTIPLVAEETWSKPFAAISSTLAPILLAALINTREVQDGNSIVSLAIYATSIIVGITLGSLTLILTNNSHPPKRFLFPWLAGGFLMSIVWTYIIVDELVSLLVAFGGILGISPSILGLTVLAWGNSVGDLISNLAMALKGGHGGAQVALSGCYAGPLFNTLVGLGLSLVLAAWKDYPSSYIISHGTSNHDLYETVGFLMGGLLWALVILPKRDMRLDKSLGLGLLAIYLCFLFLRLVKGLGLLKLGVV